MTFKLMPGDWIQVSGIPISKRQAVIDVFDEAGAIINIDAGSFFEWLFVGWSDDGLFDGFDSRDRFGLIRRVTVSQILGEEIGKNANCSWDDVGPELLAACQLLVNIPYIDEVATGGLRKAYEAAKSSSEKAKELMK